MNSPNSIEQYETLLIELKQVVRQLEMGGIPLAELVALYERAMDLATECQRLLDEASLRVKQY